MLRGESFSTLAVVSGYLWVADRSADNNGGWEILRRNGTAGGTDIAHDQGNPLDQYMLGPRSLHVTGDWGHFYASH